MRSRIKKIDYRHFLCILITLGFVACWGMFPHALGRVVESVRDLGLSIAYYFCELLDIPHAIQPTVTNLPKYPFFGFLQSNTPTTDMPDTWEGFTQKWSIYWRLWASKDNFLAYLYEVLYFVFKITDVLSLLIMIGLVAMLLFRRYLKNGNTDHDKDSRPLRIHKGLVFHLYLPVKKWIIGFINFIREHEGYWKAWLWLWAFYFNVVTVAIEGVAFYLYFAMSLDVLGLYTQVYKLFLDISAPIGFIPIWAGIPIGVILFDHWRKKIGYDRLNHNERKNRGFTNERPIVSMLVATMGMGKTTMMTCQGLSSVIMLRDKAFEKILENDLKFPYFPWINLEDSLRRAMKKHSVYNLATVRRFVQRRRGYFQKHPSRRNCFGYDYEYYGFTYDDKLKVVDVWEIIEVYAQLYFIYVIEAATLLANYSVRLDDVMSDLGNFPMWYSDFFRSDSRLIDSYSRHAKILDFDCLRLAAKLVEDNKYADAFEFGTILITECGKERGNKVELEGVKKISLKTNQKNDGFNLGLKMIRHSATVDGYPFVRIIMDEQRPESLSADARELCEIVHIRKRGETKLTMPFFDLEELLYAWVFSKFADLYYQYRHVRGDNTLPMYLMKAFTAKVQAYYARIYNRFGYHVLNVEVERGSQDGIMKKTKYYISHKKVHAKRFSTDCFSDYFTVKALKSEYGLADLPEYETEKASFEELKKQNSYFINDLLRGM